MRLVYTFEKDCYVCDFEKEDIHYFSIEQSKFIKTMIHEHLRSVFKDQNYNEKNNIHVSVTKQHIVLKNENKTCRIDYDTFLNNTEIIKDVFSKDRNKCKKCEKTVKKYYISGNLDTRCVDCKCWCDSLKCSKYTIKNKNICYMCLHDILNIEL